MTDRRSPTERRATWTMLAAASMFAPVAAVERVPELHTASDLAAAVGAYDRATISNDTRTLATLVTDDYTLVNSDASVEDKTSYLADFPVPGFRIDPYRMEAAFTSIECGAALTGGLVRLRWMRAGRVHSRHLRVAHFWVRRDGRWQLAYTQLTRVRD